MKLKIKKEMRIPLIAGIGALILIVTLLVIFIPRVHVSNEDTNPANTTNLGNNAVLYEQKYVFYNFTDPKENAFSIEIPEGWQVSSSSGIIRPYIDAGVLLQVTSENRGFLYISPYAVYTVPNSLLDFAGFTEGNYYDPSGGIATPMLVKNYTEARDFLNEYAMQLDSGAEIVDVIDRPDLINQNPNQLITRQSAAEMTYISHHGNVEIKNKLICYIYLMEYSGTGLWMASLFGYYAPESLFNETEYLVLKSEESFKVNPKWAAKEAEEINKRAGIISSTQDSVSETISSTFEYRSESQDKINDEWSKTILGVEEVYNPETGENYFVDSGAKYYWMDNKNRIYGTETDESPFPLEDITPLQIKKEV